jgi:UDP:flavonoid glycosyltransferase YjiC (YdhE family)
LADAIGRLTTDPRIRERARALGEGIRSERGVTVAVDAIDQGLQKAVPPEAG